MVKALDEQRWRDVRRFRALHEAGASVSEIARETGLNWRTVKKYLAAGGGEVVPPVGARPARGQLIDVFAHVVDAWLRAELLLKGTRTRMADRHARPHPPTPARRNPP
ncbi:helix-turn-helix domain-containing protein [Micromonospora sp. SH-82]|uniref:helix-turn-helix domain-containing protein n=1 Tax=Micromonospora sp. SH-82 TaxID=3132938 RepID=UPI003EC0671A